MGDLSDKVIVSGNETIYFNLPPFSNRKTNIVPFHIIRNSKGQPLIFTIFNGTTLLAWLSPVLVQDKPIIRISDSFHAVISKRGTFSMISGLESLGVAELSFVDVQLKFMKKNQAEKEKYSQQGNLRDYRVRIQEPDSDRKLVFDISKCKCLVTSGTGSTFSSFALYAGKSYNPAFAGTVFAQLSEIVESVRNIEERQCILGEGFNSIVAGIDEIKCLVTKVHNEIASNPERIAAILGSQTAQLKDILQGIYLELRDRDSENARTAERWRDRLARVGANTSDLIQIFGFITGITCVHTLGNALMQGIGELLRYIATAAIL